MASAAKVLKNRSKEGAGFSAGRTAVQPKLEIGKPGDRFEKEADSVADKVMMMPSLSAEPVLRMKAEESPGLHLMPSAVPPVIRLKCESCEKEEEPLQMKPEPALLKAVADDDAENRVQMKVVHSGIIQASSSGAMFASSSVSSKINTSKGQGQSLPPAVGSEMGSKIGADFSNVKIHQDVQANKLSESIGAQAFTHGSDIYFNKNKFDPGSPGGKHLLAHELTHVVQQGAAIRKKPEEEDEVIQEAPEKVQRGILDDLAGAAGAAWDATGGQMVDAAGNVLTVGADFFWSLLSNLAPLLVPILREISAKGILGFLKDKISAALSHIFDGLGNSGGVLGGLTELFGGLVTKASEIVSALASGDCGPLFAAMNQLKETVAAMAGEAWNAISNFFAPVGEFFSDLWQSWGAPVLDWLGQTASDVWTYIQELGSEIWNWTLPVRNALGAAWDWVKEMLGIGPEAEQGEGGLIQWVQRKAAEAWEFIKADLQPVIAPIQGVVAQVTALIPMDAILHLRETVQGWLSNATAMTDAMGEDSSGVTENQVSLREQVLPAILVAIQSFRQGLISAGTWVADKVGMLAGMVSSFVASLSANPLLSGLTSAVQWLQEEVNALGVWAQNVVVNLFTLVGDALVYLSTFIEPILNLLRQIVDTISNLMGKLPDLILGPVWGLIPDCIKNPVKEFIITQILGRIPLFQQLSGIADLWTRAQETAMRILSQIFVDGNLFAAAWTFFRSLLELLGIPPDLVVNIISNAAQAFSDILADPIGFFNNLLGAVKLGFQQFFGNIGTHLLQGVTGWLFSKLTEAGITPPADFTLRSVLGFVMEVLGISADHIFELLAEKIGEERVRQIRRVLEFATGVWSFIRNVVERGPGAIWESLVEQLSGLWDTVLNGVITWLNERVMAQASRWLLSLLDVTGIMPVVNSLIAMYRAIESFMAYLREMLEIVNTVVQGVADIARGNIANAATYLENALSRALPVAIGFLANQLGLGNLGERIREMVESLRERVDRALRWLIDRAVAAGSALLQMGRNAVGAVAGWLGLRKDFRGGDGENHHLSIEQSGGQYALFVASNPIRFRTFLTNKENELDHNGAAANDPLRLVIVSARTKNDDFDRALTALQAQDNVSQSARQGRSTDHNQQAFDRANQLMDQLVPLVAQLVTRGNEYPPIRLPLFANNVLGGNFRAEYIKEGRFTRFAASNSGSHRGNLEGWQEIQNAGLSANGDWVKMHLFTHRLGGLATDSNLVPGSRILNDKMEQFEDTADRAVRGNETIWYEISGISYQTVTTPNGPKRYLSSIAASWGKYTFTNGQFTPVPDPRNNRPVHESVPAPSFTGAAAMNINDMGQSRLESVVGLSEWSARKVAQALRLGLVSSLRDLEGSLRALDSPFVLPPADRAKLVDASRQRLIRYS